MTKKNIFLLTVLVGVAAVWVIYFSGWFAMGHIGITHDIHVARQGVVPRKNPQTPAAPVAAVPAKPVVTFLFNRAYALTELKVVLASAFATNTSVLPAWRLITTSNSIPIKMITYGQYIPGMKPWVENHPAQPLLPGESYKLIVKAGSRLQGEYEFKMPPAPR